MRLRRTGTVDFRARWPGELEENHWRSTDLLPTVTVLCVPILAVFYPDPGSFCARELPVEQGAGQAPWMKNSGTGGRSLEELRNPMSGLRIKHGPNGQRNGLLQRARALRGV